MKHSWSQSPSDTNKVFLDAIAAPEDEIDLRVQARPEGLTLYLDVNGITLLRIGRIQKEIEVTRES